ncbi:fumarylacetoacetate hydrolase family protein [Klebsiella oxytoca]|uniref:Fumarylacetoacetate hydrolase family protein n=1 Tax=Klebsiella oxytoca TaxID=571 RepID=A0AAI9GVI4_KLEOX|nr:fumarylacetoacetate hydrolase family protein [Klebsiella oxytoca]ELM5279628.1 fumarylacetoacetate hydrolase family protein [Klebsiella oxytoca]ELM5281381.1 fumarylacetoacetate hydrolase family protein [Klebsiella oxytoca]MBZ7278392.1 fumarylacetoacetate hydrolase family protein [Klebsiella oxytoca]MBZ7574971.1 fumarylacetoacetate hydrolase family protein [Klebsiella oxytoca]MBZ7715129.1 fumarylacetoacetate hydrolase family protein [Klebsiella oxytoca]
MKLLSFINPHTRKKTWGQVSSDKVYDLGAKYSAYFPDLKTAIAGGVLAEIERMVIGNADFRLEQVQFLPVIENPGKIFCVGMNYMEKRIEFEETIDAPTLFIRFPDSLSSHGDVVCKPDISNEFDYEGELAVIIGKSTDNVNSQNALDHVAGYSCFMDGSVRDMQYTWFTSGKNWRKTGSFGPWMVTTDEISDPQDLTISTWLNGQRVQHDSTRNMINPVAYLIEYISRFSPLEAGDVIITGSPGGVGTKRTPPLFMREGDVIEVGISRIGRLVNQVETLSRVASC